MPRGRRGVPKELKERPVEERNETLDVDENDGKPVLFKVAKDRKGIIIPFEEFFPERDVSYLDRLEVRRKRIYCNILPIIAKQTNYIFRQDTDGHLPVVFLTLKYKIESKSYKKEKDFFNEIYDKVFTENIKKIIIDIVEKNYNLQLDTEELTKYNPGLQFTDKHAKLMLEISMAMKMIIPIVMDYITKYQVPNEDIPTFLGKCFEGIFALFETDTDLQTKLFQSVHSRVIKTKYSDNVYWYYTEIIGFGIDKLVDNLTKKIIVDIFPKYSFDQNIISLNHVVVQKCLGYHFTSNFSLKYKILNLNDSDDNGLSDFDKLAINVTKINESIYCIDEVSTKLVIEHIRKTSGFKITKDEYEFYKNTFNLNKLQRDLLFLYFAKQFGGIENLYNCNLKQYIILLILMKKEMIKSGFTLLPNILTAKIKKISERKILNRKNLQKIEESPKYTNIINEKYKFTSFKLRDSGQIIKNIANILSNKFLLNNYNDENNDEEIIISNDQLIEEYLRFLEIV